MRGDCWVEVILFPLDVTPDRLRGLGSALSADEGRRAQRFRAERDRDRFIAARGMLRELLGGHAGQAPEGLRFRYGAFGKPFLAGSSAESLEFNLSHSEGMAALAVAPGRRVGVDIEKVHADLDPFEMGSVVFTSREQSFIRGLPPGERVRATFAIWTRKEAFMKARGDGFSLDPSGFEVLCANDGLAHPVAASGEQGDLHQWVLHDVPSGPEFSTAVAVEGRSIRLSRVGEAVFRGWVR